MVVSVQVRFQRPVSSLMHGICQSSSLAVSVWHFSFGMNVLSVLFIVLFLLYTIGAASDVECDIPCRIKQSSATSCLDALVNSLRHSLEFVVAYSNYFYGRTLINFNLFNNLFFPNLAN